MTSKTSPRTIRLVALSALVTLGAAWLALQVGTIAFGYGGSCDFVSTSAFGTFEYSPLVSYCSYEDEAFRSLVATLESRTSFDDAAVDQLRWIERESGAGEQELRIVSWAAMLGEWAEALRWLSPTLLGSIVISLFAYVSTTSKTLGSCAAGPETA